MYRAGRENASADALSRSPVSSPPSHGIGQDETQVSAVTTDPDQDLSSLFHAAPTTGEQLDYYSEQLKDPELKELMLYLKQDVLPDDAERSKKLVAKALFTMLRWAVRSVTSGCGCRICVDCGCGTVVHKIALPAPTSVGDPI